jgi:tripartite-type tricarboxylate transporter receptor subunit TctC
MSDVRCRAGGAADQADAVWALGVSSTARVAILPDVLPIAENGVPGFDAVAWLMPVAPAAVPRAVVDRLRANLKAIVMAPTARLKTHRTRRDPDRHATRANMQAFANSEIGRWGKVVERAGLAGSELSMEHCRRDPPTRIWSIVAA